MSRPRTFLLEVGCEEIPAGTLPPALEDLRAGLLERLTNDSGLGGECETPAVFGGPRRLVAIISGIRSGEEDRVELITGPAVSASYGADGRPTRAAIGFAKAQAVAVEQLERIETRKGVVVGVRRSVPGRAASEVLARACPDVLGAMRFPKMMKWGRQGHRFVRPVRWILALLDEEIVDFEFLGVRSGRLTYGHRFLAPGPHEVADAGSYEKILEKKGHVLVRNGRRLEAIRDGRAREAATRGWTVQEDEDLLKELAFLNEWPHVISGGFPERYLRLPEAVLVTSMRHHQKYFSGRLPDGTLAPGFLAVINHDQGGASKITRGNEWVLKARLADAEFFWSEDRKRTLEERLDDLSRISFQERLGSYRQKSERLELLVAWLGRRSGLDREALDLLKKAARLCKADLTTGMVGEFPELQGTMGGVYARAEGLPEAIARAIEEHYQPASPVAQVPRSLEGSLLSLADKLDLIVGCFSVGLIPKGSADPYGLRRAGHGIARILREETVPAGAVSLAAALQETHAQYVRQGFAVAGQAEVIEAVRDFIGRRLRHLMEMAGMSFDTARAVIAAGFDDIRSAWLRAASLSELRRTASRADFESLAVSAKRIRKILAKAVKAGEIPGSAAIDEGRLQESEERELYASLKRVDADVIEAVEAGRYDAAWKAIASLRPLVDRFFDNVLVMSEDERLRRNRLALLSSLSNLLCHGADFSEIVVEGAMAEGEA